MAAVPCGRRLPGATRSRPVGPRPGLVRGSPAGSASPARTSPGESAGDRDSPGARRRSLGQGMAARLDIARDQGQGTCHAQCPCHVQFRAQLTTPTMTLSSHGCGFRSPILVRIRSSPSAPGSTWLTAAVRACRSAFSRSSSGVVMPSPASPPDHGVSCVRIDLSAAIARAVWLFTAPLLMPIALAMSASEKSA